MATKVGDLYVKIGADGAQYERSMERVLRIDREFIRSQADLREAIDSGKLTRRQAERQGQADAKAYREALRREMQTAGAEGRLTEKLHVELTNRLDKAGKASGERFRTGFMGEMGSLATMMKAFFAGQIVGFVSRAVKAGITRLQELGQEAIAARAFGGLTRSKGINATEALRELNQATDYATTRTDLMRRANLLLNSELPLTAKNLGEVAYYSRRLAEFQGMAAEDGFQSLVRSITTLTPRGLKQLGLTVDLAAATKRWADEQGIVGRKLTQQEQQLALYSAAMAQAREKVAAMGEEQENAGVRVSQVVKFWTDLKTAVALAVMQTPAISDVFQKMGVGASNASEKIDELANKVAAFVQTYGGRIANILVGGAQGAIAGGAAGGVMSAFVGGAGAVPGAFLGGLYGSARGWYKGAQADAGEDYATNLAQMNRITAIRGSDDKAALQARSEEIRRQLASQRGRMAAQQLRIAAGTEAEVDWHPSNRAPFKALDPTLKSAASAQKEYNLTLAEQNRLQQENEAIMRRLDELDAPPVKTVGGEPDDGTTEAQRAAAVKRLTERVREFQQTAALGLPLFDEPATDAKGALQQILSLEKEITAAEEERKAAGKTAPAGTDLVLHAMRMQRDLLREGLRWNVDAAPVYRELDGISQAAKQVKLGGELDIDAVRASVREAGRVVAENPATFGVRAPSVGAVLRELNAALESGAPEVEIRARLARLAPMLAEARSELAESPLVLDVQLQNFSQRIRPELASARQLIQETFAVTPDGVVGLRAAMDAAAGAAERLAEARAKAARTDPTDTVALAVAQHQVAAAESELAQKTGLVSRALATLPPKSEAVRQATEHLMAVLQMAGITMEQLAVAVDRGLRIPKGGGANVLGEEMNRVTAATDAAREAQQRYQAELRKDPGSEATKRAREELRRTSKEAEKLGKKLIAMIEAAAAANAIPAAQAAAAIKQIRDALDDVAPRTEKTAKSATSIAERFETAGRAVLGVLDATGKLNAETRQWLTSAIDLVRAYEQMRKASTGLDKLVAGAGIVGAGISIAVGIANMIDGNKEKKREEQLKLLESNYRLVKAIDALRTQMIRDLSSGERKSILAGAEAFEKRFGRTIADIERDGLSNRMRPKLSQEEFDFLSRLEEITGTEFFDQSSGFIDIKAYREAIKAFKDADLGGFAKGVEGRLDALDFVFEHAGGVIGGATDRMRMFVDAVRQFSPDFASEFEAILKTQGMDAARVWLEQQAAAYAQGGVAAVVDVFGEAVNAAGIERILEAGFKRLDDLAEGAAGAASALNKLSGTIEGRRRLDDLEAQIRGDDAPTGQIDRELQRVKAFAPALARAFGLEGIDATTAEGREKLKAALLALIDAIRAGAITAEQLGEIGSADELLGIIGTLAGGLDSLAEHVGAMSGEIYNGVRGFKAFSYELERFRAADPSEAPGGSSPSQPPAAQPPTGPGYSPNDGKRTGGVSERPASPASAPAYLLLPPEMVSALEALAAKGVGPSAALDEQLAKLAEQSGAGARSVEELLRRIDAGLAQAARTLPAAGGTVAGPELTPAALKALAGMGGGASVTDNSVTTNNIDFHANAGSDGRIDWRQELPELMRELKRLQQLHKGESGGPLEVI